MNVHLFLVQKINQVQKINRGGWTGFGTATVGIDPNTFEVLNGHPTKIPTDEILGGVVQNCLVLFVEYLLFSWCHKLVKIFLSDTTFQTKLITSERGESAITRAIYRNV